LGANPESRVARLGDEELVDAAKFANTAAAVVCERTGCQPPTKGEILVRLRGN